MSSATTAGRLLLFSYEKYLVDYESDSKLESASCSIDICVVCSLRAYRNVMNLLCANQYIALRGVVFDFIEFLRMYVRN